MKKIITDNWSLIFSGICLIICLIFICIYKENIIIPVHDNLDSNIAWIKMLSDNNLIFKTTGEVPFLGGLDRMYLYSPLKAYIWLYMVLPTFYAYISALFLKVIISIFGFFLLGKVLDKNFTENKHIYTLCGLAYGFTPTYPTSAFSFASLPLLFAFLVLYYKNPCKKYLPLFLIYPFFSDIAVFGFFICGYLTLYILFDWIKNKKIKLYTLLPLFALVLGYIISDFNIFYTMLFSSETSIRVEMQNELYNFINSFKLFIDGFIKGQYHAGDLHTFVVLPVCIIWFLVYNIILLRNKEYKNIIKSPFNLIFIFIILNAVIYALDFYAPFKTFIGSVIPFLKGFSFERTLWLNPFLWYFAFSIALSGMVKIKKLRYLLVFTAISVLVFCKSDYNSIADNVKYITRQIKHKQVKTLTYSEFYSEKLFDKIKKDINYNGEWSCAFAMNPAILQYSRIKTLDGYLSYYPLKYKNQFKRLITPELKVDEKNEKYFQNWGGRVYLFSKETAFTPVRSFDVEEAPLRINSEVFKEMKGKYIFSRIKISNYKELCFDFINKYKEENSPYEIYVYKMNY